MGFRRDGLFKGRVSFSSKELNLLFVLVLVAGAVLRLIYLKELPIGFSHQSLDHHNQVTFRFLHYLNCTFGTESCVAAFPTLVQHYGFASFLQALVFYCCGVGYYQSAMPGVVFGILSIFVIWRIGILLLGKEYGLALAFLLAISVWHITFSRHSDAEHSLPILQALLSIYFLLLCVQSPNLITGSILGVVIGSSWYVYATNQIVPLLCIAALPVLCLSYNTSLRHRAWLMAFICCVIVSYPAVSASVSKGHFFPVRSTLPTTNNYQIRDISELVTIVGRTLSQLFIRSEDEWFVRGGGAITLAGKILGVCGIGVLLSRMRTAVGALQGAYVFAVFALGLIPAIFSPEPALRRELITLVVSVFIEGLGALYVLRAFQVFGRLRGVLLALVFALSFMWSWNEYAYKVRIPEVVNNQFYRSFATLIEQFWKQTPVTLVSTNWGTDELARRHTEFLMTDQKRQAHEADVSKHATFYIFDKMTQTVDCTTLCQPSGRIVMFEPVLRVPMVNYFRNCPSLEGMEVKYVTDFRGNPLAHYVQCP
jgi:hypothetical protein